MDAFANTSISTVIIPDTVYIEDGAFPESTRIITTSTGGVVNGYDVLCGRGNNFDLCPGGNIRYRENLETEVGIYDNVNGCDVICDRGNNFNFRLGRNIRYRKILETELDNYDRVRNKAIKIQIARRILNQMNRIGMRILKKDNVTQQYYKVDDFTAIAKKRQCLYDYLKERRAARMEEQIQQ